MVKVLFRCKGILVTTSNKFLLRDFGEGSTFGPLIFIDPLLVDSPEQARFEERVRIWYKHPFSGLHYRLSKAYRFAVECQCYLAQIHALEPLSLRRSYMNKMANRLALRGSLGSTKDEIVRGIIRSRLS